MLNSFKKEPKAIIRLAIKIQSGKTDLLTEEGW